MIDVAEPAVQDTTSAGTLLRRARETAGLHIAALAVSLKVPVRKLEALEDGRYDDVGDPVFIRALASAVCRTFKVDPQPVLQRLPQSAAPRLVRDTDGINAPFRAPSDGRSPTWIDRVRQPVPMAVLALLAGAVVIYFLPVSHTETPAVVATAPAAPAALASPVAQAASELAPALAAPVAALPATATATPVALEAQPAAPASQTTIQSAASAAANGVVVIRTKGESWVEVVDGKGTVALRKLLTAGESAGADGVLPLTVTVGKVDVTEVEVRGKKFDMRPVSKDNVARFEVK